VEDDRPFFELAAFVMKGEVSINTDDSEIFLHETPGQAGLRWSSQGAVELQTFNEKIEPRELTEEEQQREERIQTLCKKLQQEKVGEVLKQYLGSKDVIEQRVAVVCCGALDLLEDVGAQFGNPHPDVRDQAIVAARHWLGRAPGQVKKLYDYLLTQRKSTLARARTGIQLLIGISESDLQHFDTYEQLGLLLDSESIPLRSLALWHLERYLPEGKAIEYNPVADDAMRGGKIEEWKKLIKKVKSSPAN
jgi:actin-related protein